jgi:hypothetical protein
MSFLPKWQNIIKNNPEELRYNIHGELVIIGCNYHTTWQSKKGMRFFLTEINGNYATLQTRETRRKFKTRVKDLIFINTRYNLEKAKIAYPQYEFELYRFNERKLSSPLKTKVYQKYE